MCIILRELGVGLNKSLMKIGDDKETFLVALNFMDNFTISQRNNLISFNNMDRSDYIITKSNGESEGLQ